MRQVKNLFYRKPICSLKSKRKHENGNKKKAITCLIRKINTFYSLALRLRDRHVFMRQSLQIQYLNFETNFLKNENLFQKTGVPFFSLKY